MMDFLTRKKATIEAMNDPQPGDRFTEMWDFWVYVVHRNDDIVATLEGNAPITFPDGGALKTYTVEEFRNYFIDWLFLADRANDVSGWYEELLNEQK